MFPFRPQFQIIQLKMLRFLLTILVATTSASLVHYTNVSITSLGIDRYYLLTLPPGLDVITPTPVIFSFHGGNRTAEDQYRLSRMSDTSFNDFAIAAYPNGINVGH